MHLIKYNTRVLSSTASAILTPSLLVELQYGAVRCYFPHLFLSRPGVILKYSYKIHQVKYYYDLEIHQININCLWFICISSGGTKDEDIDESLVYRFSDAFCCCLPWQRMGGKSNKIQKSHTWSTADYLHRVRRGNDASSNVTVIQVSSKYDDGRKQMSKGTSPVVEYEDEDTAL